jgi:peptidoglycan L-alanyl-D-glutamate endopeptidase CwlK
MSRDPNKFEHPELIEQFIIKCGETGIKVVITSVDRDYKEQYALYCQGREPLDIVNKFRKIAGLLPISMKENTYKVTWTLRSNHVVNLDDDRQDNDKSRAFDFAVVKDGKATWDLKANVNENDIPDYKECALIGESLGLYSGMNFRNQDWPHLELKKEVA